MITRDLANTQSVGAFNAPAAGDFHSCTVTGFTCTCGGFVSTDIGFLGFGGRIIDRLGLRENFAAVVAAVQAKANVTTSAESTAMVKYYGLTIGLQHSSSTCSGGFSNYSTDEWVNDYPLVEVSTATSTGASFYSVEGADVAAASARLMTTGLTSSTSTGYAEYAGRAPVFDLVGAKRYIRMMIAPHIEATGCGSPTLSVNGILIFGDPGAGPHSTSIRGRIHVTSGCST